MRVKIYSVYIVFEDDSGNYAEFNCGDFIESEQAIERWKKSVSAVRGCSLSFFGNQILRSGGGADGGLRVYRHQSKSLSREAGILRRRRNQK